MVALNSKHADAFYNMGNVYASLKMENKAIEAYQKVIEIKPQHMDALVNLSILSFQKGNYREAVQYCDRAVASGYDAPKEYLLTLRPYRN